MKKNFNTHFNHEEIIEKMISTNQWGTFFGVSQQVLDRVWNNLTAADGNSVTYISMEIGADRDVYHPIKNMLQVLDIDESTNKILNHYCKLFLYGPEKIPNYSGGLGILAGDTLKSFADLQIPVAAISLLYRKGYFSQLVDSRIGQIVTVTEWSPETTPSLYLLKDPANHNLPLEIQVPFYDENDQQIFAHAQIWIKMEVSNDLNFFIPEILLDYSIPSSPACIREVGQHLYDSSSERTKVLQRRLLGAGIIPAMEALGITSKTIHLNEQHGVVVVIQLISQWLQENLGDDYQNKATDDDIIAAAEQVAKNIIFTIHTPVKAGHDRFDKQIFGKVGHSFCQRILHILASDNEYPNLYNFTNLALRVNRTTNSVSRLHKIVTQKQFPQYAEKITAVTNGVHHLTWISQAKAEVYNLFPELKNWQQNPGIFANAGILLNNKKFRTYLEQAWRSDTEHLTNYINNMLDEHRKQMHETWIDPPNFLSHLDFEDRNLDPGVFTVGFARRFSTYKRADLIFEDLYTLAEIIVSNNYPVNFVFSGKAHPSDDPGKSLIKLILDIQEDLYRKSHGLAKVIFIPGYDMKIAKMMVSGVHAWLNNPKRPLEASGTSGMKAALNAIPNISTMDGWWVEGYHDGLTGWKFGYESGIDQNSFSEDPSTLLYSEDSASFYRVFVKILEMYYKPELYPQYLDKCIMNLKLNSPIFNSHRMAAEYCERYKLKLPPRTNKKINKLQKIYNSEQE